MKSFWSLCALIITFGIHSQTPSGKTSPPLAPGAPTDSGISDERLQRISSMLERAVQNGEVPGGVALIARNGNIVYHEAVGMADAQKGRAYKTDDIFRIASQTKAIAATAVMMLWEEGKFKLEDPISKYIPAFKNTGVLDTFNEADSSFTTKPTDRQITIRDLITHTSGIGYGIIDSDDRFRKIYMKAGIIDLFTTEPVLIKENIEKLALLPLHHQPGEKWTYSEGLDVLGYFVEIISGMSIDEFLRKRIFDPLGMNDTWFYLPDAIAARLVPVQYREEGQWKIFRTDMYDVNYPIKGARTYFSGGAGLSSTPRDYAIFLQMYLNNGEYNGIRLLSRSTVKTIMANQIGDLWAGGPKDYGLAFGVVNENGIAKGGEGSLGTFDWGGYFSTLYFADPEEQLIGILMTQTQGTSSNDTAWKFRQMVFASIDD
jgi:CubicO group peptidase (beta-lactamase class C family)